MFCKFCGVENNDTARFCKKCGKEVNLNPKNLDVDKLKKRIKNAGDSAMAFGWILAILIIVTYPIFTFYIPNSDYAIGLSDVFLALAFSFVLIVLGKRIKKITDKNTKKYLNILIALSILWIILSLLVGGKPAILLIILLVYLIMAHSAVKKLTKVEEYKNNLISPDYRIKKKDWIIFILITVLLLVIALIIDVFLLAGNNFNGNGWGLENEGINDYKQPRSIINNKEDIDENIVGEFSLSSDDVCLENGKPIIYFFGSYQCPHSSWEYPIFKNVVSKFKGLISFHDNMDTGMDMDIFNKYSEGGIPALVLGCKYYRVGSGESIGEKEESNSLINLICRLTDGQPKDVCNKARNVATEDVKNLIKPSDYQEINNSLDFSNSVARVICGTGYNSYYDDYEYYSSGSGSIWFNGGNYWLLTNEHVLEGTDDCYIFVTKDWIEAVEDSDKAFSENNILLYYINPADRFYLDEEGYDLAFAKIEEIEQPLYLMKDIAMSPDKENCSETYPIGTKIKIFGYPTIGSDTVITLTEGIISSFEKVGNAYYYLTSAKIEEGNSGGLALVDINDNTSCTVGIPTFVQSGSIESLGRILTITEEDIDYLLSSSNQ